MSSADSPGRSITNPDNVLIFDLDGTILTLNSFRVWAGYMLFGTFKKLGLIERLSLFFTAAVILAERKLLNKSDHHYVKRQLQQLWSSALMRDPDRRALIGLIASLRQHVRPVMTELLQHALHNDSHAVLATAAAGEYAYPFGQVLGFRHIIATPLCDEGELPETRGAVKSERVLAFLTAQAWQNKKRIFFTDHAEDLPLIKKSHRVLWFGPDSQVDILRQHAPNVEIIPCLQLNANQLLKLVA